MPETAPVLTALVTGGYWLITLGVLLRVVGRRRSVSGTLAWVLVIVILPVVGILAYFLIGELSLGRRREALAQSMIHDYLDERTSREGNEEFHLPTGEPALAIHQLLERSMGLAAHSCQHLELLDNPEAIFQRLLQDLDSARDSIRMEFYIWHPGKRVDEVAEALVRASQRGVNVRVLIDHAGSRPFFRSRQLQYLQEGGVQVIPALPVRLWRFMFRRLDLRLHRKLIVIDDRIAYTGSMNMADPLSFQAGREYGPWIDIMLRLEGDAAEALSWVFSWDWEVETGERQVPERRPASATGQDWLSLLPSGPGVGEDLIEQSVLTSLYRANERIEICTPYFVPSEEVFEALCHAARRGVQVDLIVPAKNNSWAVRWASQSFYETLLGLGVRIHRFRGGLLHTKALLVDRELAMLGSVNLDVRSLQLNFELSVVLFTETSCQNINHLLGRYRKQSVPIELAEWSKRPRYQQVLERALFLLSPIL